MEQFSRKRAEDFAERMTDYIGKKGTNTAKEEYQDAFEQVDLSSEWLDFFISKWSLNEEINDIISRSGDDKFIKSQIVPLLKERAKQDVKKEIRDILDATPELYEIIADQLLANFDRGEQDREITEIHENLERNFDREFSMSEILNEICRAEDLHPADLKLMSIDKDRNERILGWNFEIVGERADRNLEHDVVYSFAYPFTSLNLEDKSMPEIHTYPTIIKTTFSTHEKARINSDEILKFENDLWQKER